MKEKLYSLYFQSSRHDRIRVATNLRGCNVQRHKQALIKERPRTFENGVWTKKAQVVVIVPAFPKEKHDG